MRILNTRKGIWKKLFIYNNYEKNELLNSLKNIERPKLYINCYRWIKSIIKYTNRV